jgi:hypothetical protein
MSKLADIKKKMRLLEAHRKRAAWLRKEYEAHKKHGRDVAGAYKLMAQQADCYVKLLEDDLAESTRLQKELDELTVRIVELEEKLRRVEKD